MAIFGWSGWSLAELSWALGVPNTTANITYDFTIPHLQEGTIHRCCLQFCPIYAIQARIARRALPFPTSVCALSRVVWSLTNLTYVPLRRPIWPRSTERQIATKQRRLSVLQLEVLDNATVPASSLVEWLVAKWTLSSQSKSCMRLPRTSWKRRSNYVVIEKQIWECTATA